MLDAIRGAETAISALHMPIYQRVISEVTAGVILRRPDTDQRTHSLTIRSAYGFDIEDRGQVVTLQPSEAALPGAMTEGRPAAHQAVILMTRLIIVKGWTSTELVGSDQLTRPTSKLFQQLAVTVDQFRLTADDQPDIKQASVITQMKRVTRWWSVQPFWRRSVTMDGLLEHADKLRAHLHATAIEGQVKAFTAAGAQTRSGPERATGEDAPHVARSPATNDRAPDWSDVQATVSVHRDVDPAQLTVSLEIATAVILRLRLKAGAVVEAIVKPGWSESDMVANICERVRQKGYAGVPDPGDILEGAPEKIQGPYT